MRRLAVILGGVAAAPAVTLPHVRRTAPSPAPAHTPC